MVALRRAGAAPEEGDMIMLGKLGAALVAIQGAAGSNQRFKGLEPLGPRALQRERSTARPGKTRQNAGPWVHWRVQT